MPVLYLTQETIDPPTTGSRIRAFGVRAALGEIGPVATAALDETGRDDPWGEMCRRMPARRSSLSMRIRDRMTSLVRGDPALLERALAAGAGAAFQDLVDRHHPRLVVLSRPFFGPFIDLSRGIGAAVVIDADESLVRAMRSVARGHVTARERLRAGLDGYAASRFEAREYARADEIWVSSFIERQYFEAAIPQTSAHIVPNLAPQPTTEEPAGPIRCVAFVGTYRYAPNQEAAMELIRSIMPAVRATGGPTELVLVGLDPTPEMKRAASQSGHVTITGHVDDPVSILRRCGVTFVPIRAGGGSRVKILEAMRSGVPVVTTARGLEGLTAVPERDVLLAETPEDFVRAVRRLTDDPTLRDTIVDAAAAFVAREHSQKAVTLAVRSALDRLPEPVRLVPE